MTIELDAQYSISSSDVLLMQAMRREGLDGSYLLSDWEAHKPKINWAEKISNFAAFISKPLDFSARCTTDIYLWTKNVLKPSTGVSPQEQRVAEIIPLEILDKLDQLRPGLKAVWLKQLSITAEETKYAVARTMQSSLLEGLVTGVVASSGGAVAALGLTRIFASIITGAGETYATQHFNKLWGQSQAFSADIRAAIKSSPDSVNEDQLVTSILMGYYDSVTFKLSDVHVWSLWLGLVIGTGISTLLDSQRFDFKKSTTIASLGAVAIWILGHKFPKSILSGISGEFGSVQAEIVDTTERGEKWLAASGEFVGSNPAIAALSDQRNKITKQKNLTTDVLNGGTPALIALLIQESGGGDLAASSFVLSTLIAGILSRNGSYMTHKSRITSRQRAIEKLDAILTALLKGDRAPLTNDSLATWRMADTAKSLEPFKASSISLQMKTLGVPNYTLAASDRDVDQVNFVSDFQVKSGEVVVLEGGNASGKTTMMQTLNGVHTGNLAQTDILWNDHDLRTMPAEMRARKFVFLSGMSEVVDLRSLLVKVVNTWECGAVFEEKKLKAFLAGSPYPELEQFVCSHFKESNVLANFDASWLTKGRKFSGYEKALLEIGMYLLINEPIVLMADEVGGALTGKNYQHLVDTICSAVRVSKHILFVGVNKDIFRWYRKDEVVAWVRMKDEVQGKMLHRKSEVSGVEADDAALLIDIAESLQDAYMTPQLVMQPSDFTTWAIGLHVPKQKRRLNTYIQSSKQNRLVDVAQSAGLFDAEREYTKYIEKCLQVWLKELSLKSNRDQLVYFQNILFALNNFYGVEAQVVGANRRVNSAICRQFSSETIEGFNRVVEPLIQRVVSILNYSKVNTDYEFDEVSLCLEIYTAYGFLVSKGGGLSEGIQTSFYEIPISDTNFRFFDIEADLKSGNELLRWFYEMVRHPLSPEFLFKVYPLNLFANRLSRFEYSVEEIDQIIETLKSVEKVMPWGNRLNLWKFMEKAHTKFIQQLAEMRYRALNYEHDV